LKSISLPDSVKSIGSYAFSDCGLESISIPDGVTSISEGTFSNCSSLESISLPDSVTGIGRFAFSDCSGLTSVNIPEGVTIIRNSAFVRCSGLTNVSIPDSVTSIGKHAFADCDSLTSVEIPSSVKSIGDDAFPLSTVIYAGSGSYAEQWAKSKGYTVDGNSTNSGDKQPASVGTVLEVSASKCKVKVLSANASNPTVSFIATTNKKATSVKIPDSVTVDDITYKVTAVAAKALSGNKKVKTVTVGKNVTSIGKAAFKSCTKLKSVNVKSTVLTKIGAEAFSGDKSLTKLTLKTTKLTKKSVGKNALKGTNKKLVVKVPKKQVAVYKKYFKSKGSKTVKVKK
jgi:hypothetical protein